MKYVRAWEAARRQQYVLRYELDVDELKRTSNDHCVRERNENRVNDILTRYLTRRIAVSAKLLSKLLPLKMGKNLAALINSSYLNS